MESKNARVEQRYYKCPWCGHEFLRMVKTIIPPKLISLKEKFERSGGSDQVSCSRCGNFLKVHQ